MKLRKKLENTLLLSSDIKQKLLSIPNWTKEIENIVKELFDKYWELEEKVIKWVINAKWKLYIKSLNDIENYEKQEELKELKKIEEKLKNI